MTSGISNMPSQWSHTAPVRRSVAMFEHCPNGATEEICDTGGPSKVGLQVYFSEALVCEVLLEEQTREKIVLDTS